MTFFEFLDIKYRSTSKDLSIQYNVAKEGYARAAHSLVSAERTVAKWVSYPILIGHFFLVKLHLAKAPKPMEIKIKETILDKDNPQMRAQDPKNTLAHRVDTGL